jgi:hypothetical protein
VDSSRPIQTCVLPDERYAPVTLALQRSGGSRERRQCRLASLDVLFKPTSRVKWGYQSS